MSRLQNMNFKGGLVFLPAVYFEISSNGNILNTKDK